MTLREPGKWTDLFDDPAASNGLAGKLLPNHTVWAIHLPIPKAIYALKPVQNSTETVDAEPRFHIYAWLRCDASALDSPAPAFQVGVFDPAPWKPVFQRAIPTNQASGPGYTRLDLGNHVLPPTAYFWVAPLNKPDQIRGIYLDRVVFVRE